MKRIIKLFSMSVVFGVISFVSAGIGASAAAIPSNAITIDYDRQRLTVKESTKQGTDLQVYFAVPTIKTVRNKNASGVMVKNQVMTASSWDTYDYDKTTGVTIDLSSLNRKKDNYVQLKGDKNTEPVTIKIPAVLTKVTASFNAKSAVVTVKDVTDKKQPVPVANKAVEYRTQYSNWNTYNSNEGELSMYQMRGATLYFRLSAHKSEALNITASSPVVSDMVDSNGGKISIYEAGSFPGTEMKIVVGRRAAAPKIGVDYSKHQFSLPKNTEYRVVAANKLSSWTSVGSVAKKLNLSEISSYINGNSAILEVRTEATLTRPCSVAGKLEFEMPPAAPQLYTVSKGVAPGQILENNIIENGVGVDLENWELDVAYVHKQATKQLTGLRFYNTTTDVYEVFISKDGAIPTPASAVHLIKAKTPNSVKDAETNITTKYVKNGDRVYIRKRANAKNKIWSSYFAGLGTVDFEPWY